MRALNNQGLALRGLKRFEEARRALKRASRHATDDPLVLTNLGAVLVDLGRAAEARSLHEHALRGLPGDSRILTNYGICLAALGERDRARETLDNALATIRTITSTGRTRGPRRMSAGADHLTEVKRRIAEAAKAAGRAPADVTLVAVSKTHGAGARPRAARRRPARVRREPRAGGARRNFPPSRPNIPTSSCT